MRTPRRILLVALVWLLAAAVSIAGLPQFQCLCARGPSQPITLALPSPDSGCRCGGHCCGSTESGSCCRAAEAQSIASTEDSDGVQLRSHSSGCTGTLTLADSTASSPTRAAGAEPTPAFGLALPLMAAPLAVFSTTNPPFRDITFTPPPTDRVVVFQHFVI